MQRFPPPPFFCVAKRARADLKPEPTVVWTRSHQGLRHGSALLHGLQQREGKGEEGGGMAADGGGAVDSFLNECLLSCSEAQVSV